MDEPAKKELRRIRMQEDEARFLNMVDDINEVLAYLTQVEIEKLRLTNSDQNEIETESKLLKKILIIYSKKHD